MSVYTLVCCFTFKKYILEEKLREQFLSKENNCNKKNHHIFRKPAKDSKGFGIFLFLFVLYIIKPSLIYGRLCNFKSFI